jgi:uncharacterized protein
VRGLDNGYGDPLFVSVTRIVAMNIQVGGLSEGVHEFQFRAVASDLGLDHSFPQELRVDTCLERIGHQIALQTAIETVGVFQCDRCTSKFETVLKPTYNMVYVIEGTETGNIDGGELQIIPSGLGVIDISEDVRQAVVLSVPLKLLCSESCKGLCAQCGVNLNIATCSCSDTAVDPRWEALRELIDKDLHNPS